MNNINWSLVLTGVGYIAAIALLLIGAYLKVLDTIVVSSLVFTIIGNFLGVLVPSPIKQSTTAQVIPQSGNRLPDRTQG